MGRIIYSGLIYIQFKRKKLGCPICEGTEKPFMSGHLL